MTFLVALTLSFGATAQDFKTFTYHKADSAIQLDLFLPDTDSKNIPLVIFVHGGGFAGGVKEDGHIFARELVEKGIACASIDYPLYMQDKSFSCDGILTEKVKAIQIGANYTWKATSFLLQKSKALNIDTSRIILAGSSAGAETVLHAAYWDRNKMKLIDHNLPKSFTFYGLMSGAGAIMDLNIITAENVLPTFVFHGDQDELVPYRTASHHYCPPNASGWLMLFGSASIIEHVDQFGITSHITTYAGGGHEHSATLFEKQPEVAVQFAVRILAGEKFQERFIR